MSPQTLKMFSLAFGEQVAVPFECIHHAFEAHAAASSFATAVEHSQLSITYGQLDILANYLAQCLRQFHVGPNDRVILLAERGIDMIAAILAVLKAGGAYVPLDGNIAPQSTVESVISDTGCQVVLCLRKFLDRLSAISHISVLCIEDSLSQCRNGSCSKPKDVSKGVHSAYVIFTSGTTGRPKGVDVMHSNVTNLLCLAPGNLGMRPGMRVSQLMNIAFDMAVWEILGSLANGCTLCIRGNTSHEWRALLKTVDIMIATPSMLRSHHPADYPNLKTVAVAGEACPQPLADLWAEKVTFYNCCGPTEITIVNTMHSHIPGTSLSIGRPTPNNAVYVLDMDMKPLGVGETGVMWAGGAGISRGYLNAPKKTAEKYRLDPFLQGDAFPEDHESGKPSRYMFNTGDLGRWRANGSLEHLGRVDHQVKVKGFRVELDSVALTVEVHAAAALLVHDELWAFVVPTSYASLSLPCPFPLPRTRKPAASALFIQQLKSAVVQVLPYYAVPTQWLILDGLPQTTNNKVDRKALEKMALDVSQRQDTEKTLEKRKDSWHNMTFSRAPRASTR